MKMQMQMTPVKGHRLFKHRQNEMLLLFLQTADKVNIFQQ